jgi:hypothetical protein
MTPGFCWSVTETRSVGRLSARPQIYSQHARDNKDLSKALNRLAKDGSPALVASALEFILEGLHLNKKLNKKVLEGEITYWG